MRGALRLDPSNADARTNLEFVNSGITNEPGDRGYVHIQYRKGAQPYRAATNSMRRSVFARSRGRVSQTLEQNAMSEKAMYNLAVSLLRRARNAGPNSANNPIAEASVILTDLAKDGRRWCYQ